MYLEKYLKFRRKKDRTIVMHIRIARQVLKFVKLEDFLSKIYQPLFVKHSVKLWHAS